MNILFITMVWPLAANDSNLYSDLMDEFVVRGHNVFVATLCEKRNKISTGISIENGIEVLRVKCGNIQKTNKFNKVISSFVGGFLLKKYVLKYYNRKQIDLIVFALPPLTIAKKVVAIKKRFDSKLYLLLKEFWPQDPADLGALKVGGLVWKYFKRLEFILLNNSEYIGTMSKKGIEYVNKNYPNINSVIEINTNSERDRGFIKLTQTEKNKIRGEFGIDVDKKAFVFGGNLGVSQGINEMICSIKECADLNDIKFIIVGNGTEKKKLTEELSNQSNVVFLDMLKKNEYERLVKACDFGLIFLSPKFSVPNIPSRTVTYLMYGLPIVVCANNCTDIGEIIEQNGCGYASINGDVKSFKNNLIKIMSGNYNELSDNCIKLFKKSFSTSVSCETIISHFN